MTTNADTPQYNVYSVQHQSKITRHVKKQENMPCKQEKNQSIETEPEMAGMIELANKYFKITIINMYKDLKENN